MTTEEKVRLVEGQLQSYNKRDIDGFCSFFHPDVVVKLLVSNQETSRGMEAFRKGYAEMFANSPQLKCELKSRVVLGDAILDEEWVTGSARFPDGIHTMAIYAFREGLIDRVWFPR